MVRTLLNGKLRGELRNFRIFLNLSGLKMLAKLRRKEYNTFSFLKTRAIFKGR